MKIRASLIRKEWWLRGIFALGMLCCVVIATGCFPGSSTPPGGVSVGPPAPLPSPSFGTSSVTSNVVDNGGTTNAALPTPAGFSGSVQFPIASPSPGTQITTTLAATPPPSGPPPLDIARVPQSLRSTMQSGIEVVYYMWFVTNQPLLVVGDPIFTLNLPQAYASVTGLNYFLAIYEQGAWQLGYAGPGTLSNDGSTVTLTGLYPLLFAAGTPDYLALYAQSVNSANPTPPPTPSPVPSGQVGIGVQ